MSNLEKVEEILKKHKTLLKEKFYVEKIGIFGSYSRREDTLDSDIDVLVEFNGPIGWKFFILKEFLEEILKRKVDLATKNALRPQMKSNVLKDVFYV